MARSLYDELYGLNRTFISVFNTNHTHYTISTIEAQQHHDNSSFLRNGVLQVCAIIVGIAVVALIIGIIKTCGDLKQAIDTKRRARDQHRTREAPEIAQTPLTRAKLLSVWRKASEVFSWPKTRLPRNNIEMQRRQSARRPQDPRITAWLADRAALPVDQTYSRRGRRIGSHVQYGSLPVPNPRRASLSGPTTLLDGATDPNPPPAAWDISNTIGTAMLSLVATSTTEYGAELVTVPNDPPINSPSRQRSVRPQSDEAASPHLTLSPANPLHEFSYDIESLRFPPPTYNQHRNDERAYLPDEEIEELPPYQVATRRASVEAYVPAPSLEI